MKRYHLFEFGDQDWFPQFLKDMLTDYLNFTISLFKLHDPAIPILAKALDRKNEDQVLDLCSGGGGGMVDFSKALAETCNRTIQFTLTDKHPNLPALQASAAKADGRIAIHESPIDAMEVPSHLTGFRTIFNALHHFPPTAVKSILHDAVKEGRSGLAVFEILNRSLANVIFPIFLIPIFVLVLTPFIRPFRWERILFTYLIPILPLIICWDGIVSTMRIYKPEELEEMAQSADPDGTFDWQSGIAQGTGNSQVTYLIGVPHN